TGTIWPGHIIIVEVAKVHVIGLNSPGPTWRCQSALCAVAQRPTSVDVRMTDGTGRQRRKEGNPAGLGRLCSRLLWGNGDVFSYVTGGLAYGKVDLDGTSTASGTALFTTLAAATARS